MVVRHSLSGALAPLKYYSWQTSVSMKFEPQFIQVVIRNSCIHPWTAGNQTSNDLSKNMEKSGEWAHRSGTDYLQFTLCSQKLMSSAGWFFCDFKMWQHCSPCSLLMVPHQTASLFCRFMERPTDTELSYVASYLFIMGVTSFWTLFFICQFSVWSHIELWTGTCT